MKLVQLMDNPNAAAVLCDLLNPDELEADVRLMEDSLAITVTDGYPVTAEERLDYASSYLRVGGMLKKLQGILKGEEVLP